MNGKKIACLLLLLIVAGVAYGTQIMQRRCQAMLDEAEAAGIDARTAEGQRNVAETELKRLEFDTQDLRQFLADWGPAIKRIQTAQEADQAISSILRNSGILTISQKFEIRENRDQKVVPKILQGTLIVQDEYSKTLNWLGELERRLPLARVTSCRLKQGETGRQVSLEIHFEIPMINLDAQPEEAKK